MNYKHDCLTLLIILGVDSLWLELVTPKFYRSQIGHLMVEIPSVLASHRLF